MRIDSKISALIIFSLISLIIIFPIFTNIELIGKADWDQHFFYNEAPRKIILDYFQFPLWNPYYCGGNLLLANPQIGFLSPMFVIVLIFGAVIGLKIEIFLHLVIGMFGMFLLSKHFRLAKYSSYLPSIIFMLSSFFLMQIRAGHPAWILPIAYMPFVFFFYLKSLKNFKFSIISALFLALMYIQGGVYPFVFTILFLLLYSFFGLIIKRKILIIKVITIILILTVLFSAVKLIPSYDFLKDYSYKRDYSQPNKLTNFYHIFLNRNQNYLYENVAFFTQTDRGKIPWGWHEYSAYIGILPLLLFLASFYFIKKEWQLILITITFIIMSLGGFIWKIFHSLPFMGNLHVPSRFIMISVFCIALLAGKTLSHLENKQFKFKLKGNIIALVIIIIILLDLMLINYPIVKNIFTEKIRDISKNKEFAQVAVPDVDSEYNMFNSMYPNLLQNYGTVNCYERLHLDIKATPKLVLTPSINLKFEDYIAMAYIAETKEPIPIIFSPNKIKLDINNKEGTLVINQNYYKDWKIKGKEVINHSGLLATKITKADKEVILYFTSKTFIIGWIISIISIIISLIVYIRSADKYN